MTLLKESNLLVISNRYPHIGDSISSCFVKDQVDAISKYFEKVTVIGVIPFVPKFLSKFSFTNPRWRRDAFAYDYKYNNIDVYFAKHFTLPFNHSRKKRGDVAFKAVNKLIQKEKIDFDLIHAHFTYPAGYVGAKLKERYGKQLIITGHGHDVYDLPFRDESWKMKIKKIILDSDKLITVSESNKHKLLELGAPEEKIDVIYNGYDSKLFKPVPTISIRKKFNIPKDKKIVLSIGNLEPNKGHRYLIQAISLMSKTRKDILCMMVGSGPFKNHLETLILELKLQEYVKLVGGKPHSEIPRWMNACDVFVLPSLKEGNPTVMFEALSCGKPFVGTNVGGIPEIITNEKLGILVKPTDAEGLAKAILKALDNQWDKEYILNYDRQFTWGKIAEKIMEVYDEVLEES